jgi:hypothetical protein
MFCFNVSVFSVVYLLILSLVKTSKPLHNSSFWNILFTANNFIKQILQSENEMLIANTMVGNTIFVFFCGNYCFIQAIFKPARCLLHLSFDF